jgi:multidrug transporter EmrE-like cation transporter
MEDKMNQTIPKIIFFSLIAAAVAFEVVADILLKKWSLENKNIMLIIGLALYFVGTVFWAVSLKYDLLSKAISIFTVLNLIVIILVGVFMFKENLSLINKIGLALGVLSIIFVEL